MKAYTFHTGKSDTDAQYIFNTKEHRHLQSEKDWRCFYVNTADNTCLAFIWFHIFEKTASSPFRATFGGFECHATLATNVITEFLQYIEEELKKDSIKDIRIKQPPLIYDVHGEHISSALLGAGYHVVAEISSAIPITANTYATIVHSWELRKLKQAMKEELMFQHEPDLHPVYEFIEHCRSVKGYKLSMGLKDVEKLKNTFPDKVLLFGVRGKNHLAAACIALKISSNVLYTFYYDHHADYHSLSPVVLLMEGIYNYCQLNGIHYLDLGTAMLDGEPNIPLLTFKTNLGGKPSSKFTFSKKL